MLDDFHMPERMNWDLDGSNWSNREHSRFVDTVGTTWHIQEAGHGPTLLLIHGTGASTHSWRRLLPLLAERFRVLALDLPGHGFTRMAPMRRLTLGRMARSVRDLLAAVDFQPDMVVGHSAGAPILARMIIDGLIDPKALVSLNGSFKPFPGMAGSIFPAMARLLFINPVTPRVFAYAARDRGRIKALIDGTGSKIDEEGIDIYQRLFMAPAHVNGTLSMMANWDLEPLYSSMKAFQTPLILVAASNDRTIAPADARSLSRRAPKAELVEIPGLGHLAHEEDPETFSKIVSQSWETLESASSSGGSSVGSRLRRAER